MTTKINRTPFRLIKDIPLALLALDEIQWEAPYSQYPIGLTRDGKRYSYTRSDGTVVSWTTVRPETEARPLNRTWEEVEALASGTTFTFPCATVEITYRAAPTHKTYIVAVPKGRRKYVKLYLQARGCRNVDALPYNTTDAPFYMGCVTKQVCDDLRALAPDILLTY